MEMKVKKVQFQKLLPPICAHICIKYKSGQSLLLAAGSI